MKATKPLALALLAVALIAGVYALFVPRDASPLHVTGAKAAPIEGVPGEVGIFLTIDNPGPPDRLIAASSAAAAVAVIDAPQDTLAIPAGSTPVLAPDGAFVRLKGVSGPLEDGQLLPVSLEFEHAGTRTIQARLSAPRHEGEAHEMGLFGIGEICRVGEGEPAPQIALEVVAEGDGWRVRVLAQGFEFARDLADGPHVPGTGHGHLYLDGLKLQRLYEAEAHIGALPTGQHEVRVTLNTNDHRAYVVDDLPVTAQAVIEVR